jgi:hypothetical protein
MPLRDVLQKLFNVAAPAARTPVTPSVVIPPAVLPPDKVEVSEAELQPLKQAWREFGVHKQEVERRLPQIELERYALLRKYEKLEEACDKALVDLRLSKHILDEFGDYELDLDKDPSKGGVLIRDDQKN